MRFSWQRGGGAVADSALGFGKRRPSQHQSGFLAETDPRILHMSHRKLNIMLSVDFAFGAELPAACKRYWEICPVYQPSGPIIADTLSAAVYIPVYSAVPELLWFPSIVHRLR